MIRRLTLAWIITIIVLELIFTIIASESPLKVATGFLLVAFLPGYTFLEVVYRRYRHDLGEFEQIALAIPLSLMIDVLLGLLANRIPWIGINSYVIWMVLLILGVTIFSIGMDSLERELNKENLVLLVGLICLSVIFGYLVSSNTNAALEPYLSLSIIPNEGEEFSFPTTTVVDELIHFNIQLVHHGANGKMILLVSGGNKQQIYLDPDDQRVIHYVLFFPKSGYYQCHWDIIDTVGGESLRSVRIGIHVDDHDDTSN